MKKNTIRLTLRGKVVAAILAAITAIAVGYTSMMFVVKSVDEVINYQNQGTVYAQQMAEMRAQAE